MSDQVADVALITPSIAASHLAKVTQPKQEIPTQVTSIRRWDYVFGFAIVIAALIVAIALLARPV